MGSKRKKCMPLLSLFNKKKMSAREDRLGSGGGILGCVDRLVNGDATLFGKSQSSAFAGRNPGVEQRDATSQREQRRDVGSEGWHDHLVQGVRRAVNSFQLIVGCPQTSNDLFLVTARFGGTAINCAGHTAVVLQSTSACELCEEKAGATGRSKTMKNSRFFSRT